MIMIGFNRYLSTLFNAIKYSNRGDIIDVISAIEDNHIVVSIRDYGPGISKIEQKRIFNAFYRVEEDRSGAMMKAVPGWVFILLNRLSKNMMAKLTSSARLAKAPILLSPYRSCQS